MVKTDYLIIILYFIGLLILGATLGRRINSSKEMFIAGKNSSWWLSGLSTYMSIFSASTFCVWGGVAYRSGVVAIVVGVMLGFASFAVGRYLAPKWANMGLDSPAQYLGIRFGKPTINFFTTVGMFGKGIHTAVALYAVAIMAVALIPLPEGHFLADAETGNLSVTYAVMVLGIITLAYTATGGFIAVLMTDVVQFAILIAMIVIMVPLSFDSAGGVSSFVKNAPPEFFNLLTSEYSWIWMTLWLFLNFFFIGGEWAFVQRYISVPSAKQASRSVYLVGALYLVTPLIFYIPTLVYRELDSSANPEQAYMLMSQLVLPAGMLGIMMAAMLSATMSMASGTLNVYANVFTYDIFKSLRPEADDKTLMRVGRSFTFGYGLIITVVAILIPFLGGAEKVVVSILNLVVSPIFIPSIWGLFSKKINQRVVITTMCITFVTAIFVKLGLIFTDISDAHPQFVDAFIGLVFPIAMLSLYEIYAIKRPVDEGYRKISQMYVNTSKITVTPQQRISNAKAGAMYSRMAFTIIMGTYGILGLVLLIFAIFNETERGEMIKYGTVFAAIAAVSFSIFRFFSKSKKSTI